MNNTETTQIDLSNWSIKESDAWCVLSKNCGNEHKLLEALPHILSEQESALISFKSLQQVYEHELKIDETDLTDEIDFGTPVQDFLPEAEHNNPLIDTFDMRDKMTTGFRQLSTGESRKLLLLQAALEQTKYIICENPFDSLDVSSCAKLANIFNTLHQHGFTLVLMLNNQIDIPNWCQQFAIFADNQVIPLSNSGAKLKEAKQQIAEFYQHKSNVIEWPEPRSYVVEERNLDRLVDIKNAKVSFQGKDVFTDLNLQIKPLQHTLVVGKNGAGKSTLLQLVTGDCPQCFSNDVTVFGYRRGNGETIWDIKKHIGLISSDLHRSYRVRCDVLNVIASGFFDSIGIYQTVTRDQAMLARQWLKIIGLEGEDKTMFHSLSHGQQRLVLIARALVKSPALVLMDEPTQGLDESNRLLILSFLQKLASNKRTTILYISHREDEHLPIFEQVLHL